MGCLLTLVFFALCGIFGYVILEPVIRAGGKVRCPPQFFLSDLFWLMLLLQLPLWFLSCAVKWCDAWQISIGAPALLLVCVIVWFRGASRLTRLGILDARRRGVFLVVILPMAIAGSLAAGVSTAIALMASHESNGVSLLLLIPIAPVCYAGRLLTLWVLSGSPDTGPSAGKESPATSQPPPTRPDEPAA